MKNKIVIIIIAVLASVFAITAISYLVVSKYFFPKGKSYEQRIIKYNISETPAKINKYTVYGNHLNIFGILDIEKAINYADFNIKLVTLNSLEDQRTVDFTYEIKDGILTFYTSSYINKGIDLEKLDIGNYTFYIKLEDKTSGLSTYYPLENITEYGDLEYYTITKNGKNNYIKIYFDKAGLNITCSSSILPDDVYDIVIDQGHGGSSTGAIHNGYIESELNYKIGIKLKESLEKLGLKVLVTRSDINQTVGNYNNDGRAVIPNKVKSKLCFSVHNNSSIYEDSAGVEIYAPNFADLSFAKSMADNIVNIASSSYSRNTEGYVMDGVYVLKFSEKTIEECLEEAKIGGYEPYKMDLNTNMFFMIREVGGICTGAYMDGRDKENGTNPYWNSNITAESYLLELGYLSNKKDIENVAKNMDKYADALTKSIKAHLEL